MPRTPRRPATIAKAASHYEVTTRTVYRWIREGKLPAYRVGGRLLRIDLDDLDQLAQPVPAGRGQFAGGIAARAS